MTDPYELISRTVDTGRPTVDQYGRVLGPGVGGPAMVRKAHSYLLVYTRWVP